MTWGRRLTLEDCKRLSPYVAHLKSHPRCHFFMDRDGLWKFKFSEDFTESEHVKANDFCDYMQKVM